MIDYYLTKRYIFSVILPTHRVGDASLTVSETVATQSVFQSHIASEITAIVEFPAREENTYIKSLQCRRSLFSCASLITLLYKNKNITYKG